jgi:hypothetical protein
MVEKIKNKKKNDWEEVKDPEESIWRPEAAGDEILGRYIEKERDVGPYKSTKYTLETDEGEVYVFGSTVLDRKFDDVPIGYEVKIIYQGEKPSKPPKKPFKLFQVFKRPAKR